MQVNIYVETDIRSLKKQERTVMYLLECRIRGMPITKNGMFMRSGSLHECILEGITKALGRVVKPSSITIFTSDSMLLDMIGYYLPEWVTQDFRKKNGEEIANRDLWMEFYDRAHEHSIVTHRGGHEYRSWMLAEIRRKKEEDEGNNRGSDIQHN